MQVLNINFTKMQTKKVHFLKPTFVKMIIFFIPILILFVWGFIHTESIGGGLFPIFSLGFLFCTTSFWACSGIEWIPGLIIIYLSWYIISCLLVLGYQKIKSQK